MDQKRAQAADGEVEEDPATRSHQYILINLYMFYKVMYINLYIGTLESCLMCEASDEDAYDDDEEDDENPSNPSTGPEASRPSDPAPVANPMPDAVVASNPMPDAVVASTPMPDAVVASSPMPDAVVASNPMPDAVVTSNVKPDAVVAKPPPTAPQALSTPSPKISRASPLPLQRSNSGLSEEAVWAKT